MEDHGDRPACSVQSTHRSCSRCTCRRFSASTNGDLTHPTQAATKPLFSHAAWLDLSTLDRPATHDNPLHTTSVADSIASRCAKRISVGYAPARSLCESNAESDTADYAPTIAPRITLRGMNLSGQLQSHLPSMASRCARYVRGLEHF